MTILENQILDSFETGEKIGISYIQVDKVFRNSAKVLVDNNVLVSFGNCSYLGIDHLDQIRAKILAAVDEYGGLYSSSRAFSSLRYLSQTEEKINQLFGRESILYTTTGIGHLSVIPNLVTRKDLIIYDKQVHRTVQNAILIAKGQGTTTIALNHNATDQLEEIVLNHKDKYEKIYLMVDSIYSMSGEIAPLNYYYQLVEKIESLYLYVDDAHGMSWTGKCGTGLMLSQISWHEKLIMATSFSKGFGANGGAVLFPTKELKDRMKYLGSGTVFSAPLPPPSIAAIDASADLHLSNEVILFQQKLFENITFFYDICKHHHLPLKSSSLSPVNYIELGMTENTIYMVSDLIKSGFLVNACAYPAVPKDKSGIRISITSIHTNDEIQNLVKTIGHRL